jgi:hypothetical protein
MLFRQLEYFVAVARERHCAGEYATIVPHTWLHAMPVVGTARIVRLIEPDARARMAVAISATTPGSMAARAFVAAAQSVALDEFFETRCYATRAQLDNSRLSNSQSQALDVARRREGCEP